MSNLDNPAFSTPIAITPSDDVIHAAPGFSKREYAAIHLKVPNSGDEELDKMILQSLMISVTAKFLSGALANPTLNRLDFKEWLHDASGFLTEVLSK